MEGYPSVNVDNIHIPSKANSTGLQLTAKSAAVYRASSSVPTAKDAIYEMNPLKLVQPASLTKILTAITALRIDSNVNRPVTIGESDMQCGGSGANLQCGDVITFWDALHNMFLPSSNMTASAIARTFGRMLFNIADSEKHIDSICVANFINEMNITAMDIGMFESVFMNVHGLGARGQRTCARDIGRLMYEAVKYPAIMDTWSKRKHVLKVAGPKPRLIPIQNTVEMLQDGRVQGGKTGTLAPSFYNLALFYTLPDGNEAFAVTLYSSSKNTRDDDMLLMLDAVCDG